MRLTNGGPINFQLENGDNSYRVRGGGFYGALLYPTADVYVRTDTLSWKGLDTDRFIHIYYARA